MLLTTERQTLWVVKAAALNSSHKGGFQTVDCCGAGGALLVILELNFSFFLLVYEELLI